jgi:hypothetical protein
MVHASRKDSDEGDSLIRMIVDSVCILDLVLIVLSEVVGRVNASVCVIVVMHRDDRDFETDERETGGLCKTEKPSAPPSSIKRTARLIRHTFERVKGRILGFRGVTGIPIVNVVFILLSSFSVYIIV